MDAYMNETYAIYNQIMSRYTAWNQYSMCGAVQNEIKKPPKQPVVLFSKKWRKHMWCTSVINTATQEVFSMALGAG